MFDEILAKAPLFLMLAVRALAMIETAPLISSDSNPQVAKVALAGFTAFSALPSVPASFITADMYTLSFAFMLVGEAIIGIILGFYLTIIYSAFSAAGQFFSLQMGFGASETFDPLAQIENPLLGQFLNLIAMLVFLTVDGFQKLFLGGFFRSLQSMSVASLIKGREQILKILVGGFSSLFLDALVLSMPILGTLFLISLAMGLLSKAAPQMNLLTEGFPISITVAYVLILATLPFLVEAFSRIIDGAFGQIEQIFVLLKGVT